MAKPTAALSTTIVFAFVIFCASAVAQARLDSGPAVAPSDLSIQDLGTIRVDTVNGASKFLQQVLEAPASVTIITGEQIRKYGYRTLAEALASAPGIYISNDRTYSYVGLRGFGRPFDYNNCILILVDGHRINDDIYDAAFIDTAFPIDIDLIQRIEVIRGPGSALYGSNVFFGVVNVITRRGGDLKGVEIAGAGGSLGTYRTRVSYGKQYSNGLEAMISASAYQNHGYRQVYFPEFDSPATNNGIAQNADGDRFYSSIANVSYGKVAFRAAYVWREKHAPTAFFGTVFNDPRTRTRDSRGYFEVEFQHTLTSDWQLNGRASYDQSGYNGTYVYDLGTTDNPLITLNHDSSRGQWLGYEVSASRRLLEKQRISIGSEGRFNVKQLQQTYYDDPSGFVFYDRRSSIIPSAYVLDEFRIRRNLILSAGLRYDHYYTFGGTFNPRFGLIYMPRQSMAIKLLYGQAFRAPNAYELYYQDGVSVRADPSLRPETIHTTELAVEKYFANHVTLRTSAFQNHLNNLVTESSDAANVIRYVTRQDVTSRGLEFALDERRPNRWEASASYTVSESFDSRSLQPLSNSPKHLAKARLSIPLFRRALFASPEAQYVSSRLSVYNTTVPDHFVANFSLLTSPIWGKVDLRATGYNLLGKRYGDPAGLEFAQSAIPQDGRVFQVHVEYHSKPKS
jgi:outer membrane receptor for ferrienterochelin and colicins